MKRISLTRPQLALAVVTLITLAGALGYAIAQLRPTAPAVSTAPERRVLYWYDPMAPDQHFTGPGKSPSMDMQLVPKYADESVAGGVRVDSSARQSLGMRLATVHIASLAQEQTVPGIVDFDQRAVAVVQSRASGFVQRAYSRAPGDVVAAGAPIADLLLPEWTGAQSEYLAVRRSGNSSVTAAARQRLVLLGMSPALIAQIERSGRPQASVTVTTPIGGVIRTLGVRAGMSVTAGQTLAEINGLGHVWITASVAQAQAGSLAAGGPASVTVDAYPGETFAGRVAAILPEAQSDSRTVQVRIEVANRGGRLRPGMFAMATLPATQARQAVLAPSEAVIRTGQRTLIMVARGDGRFEPRRVRVGREAGGQTEILSGLADGERVVASGQFLVDSEASLSGVNARLEDPGPAIGTPPALHEAEGRVEALATGSVTLSHGVVPSAGWPAMTMTFRVTDPGLVRSLKPGDRVRFAFDQPQEGATVRRMSRVGR